jgi:hypothetical protein
MAGSDLERLEREAPEKFPGPDRSGSNPIEVTGDLYLSTSNPSIPIQEILRAAGDVSIKICKARRASRS